MFGTQLYPTPETVIDKMVQSVKTEIWDYKLRSQGILDPSAGTGAILTHLKNNIRITVGHLYGIEIDPDLRYLLQKDFSIVGTDFLAWKDPIIRFGIIMMNPPFKDGAKHVLHAWEFALSPGGAIVALVNAETVNNLCDKNRQMLANLVTEHGSLTKLGQCFKDSENPTDCEVVMITLRKPAEKGFEFDDGNFTFRNVSFEAEKIQENPLVASDAIDGLVAQYQAAINALIERDKTERNLAFLLKDIRSGGDRRLDECQFDAPRLNLTERAFEIRVRFWNHFFDKTEIAKRTTSKFQSSFDQFQKAQGVMDFTRENILEVLNLFFENYAQIMQDCLVNVFDELTRYHEKNAVYPEGWKTNQGWKIANKIIHPSYASGYFSMSKYRDNAVEDLERVLMWIGGIKENVVTVRKTVDPLVGVMGKIEHQHEFETTFFHGKLFKKGTIHLRFKDQELLNEFNRRAAIGKQWIGGEGY
jgi:hypothetical protein